MKKKVGLVFLALVLCLSIVGCSGTETISIGAIPQDPSVEFYTRMVEGYQDGAKEMGVELMSSIPITTWKRKPASPKRSSAREARA